MGERAWLSVSSPGFIMLSGWVVPWCSASYLLRGRVAQRMPVTKMMTKQLIEKIAKTISPETLNWGRHKDSSNWASLAHRGGFRRTHDRMTISR